MSRALNAKRERFHLRFPNFEKELNNSRKVMCFVMHPGGSPIYIDAERLWNRVNNQYQKMGFIYDKLMTQWVMFYEEYYDGLVNSHVEWWTKRTEGDHDYSTVSKRTISELEKWFLENYPEEVE